MMNTLRNKLKEKFTQIPNELITNENISDRARFLFIYLASRPDDWKFWNKDLEKITGCKSDTLRKHLRELQNTGWLIHLGQIKDLSNGKFGSNIYQLNDKPSFDENWINEKIWATDKDGKKYQINRYKTKKKNKIRTKISDSENF